MLKYVIKNISKEFWELTKHIFDPITDKDFYKNRIIGIISRLFNLFENLVIAFKYISYVARFSSKLKSISATPNDFIQKKLLEEYDYQIYPVFIYLLNNHSRIKGLRAKLLEFFTIVNADVEFKSQFNEIVGIHFIEKQLQLKVLEVEIKSQPIISPYCKNNKSCDILANDGNQNIYFESKKSLSQDLRPREKMGSDEGFTPISNSELYQWIRDKLFDANLKGADYLLIRIPFWTPVDIDSEKEKYNHWISRTFKENEKISENVFRIKLDRLILNITKGFYIIFPNNYIKVEVISNNHTNEVNPV